jgi:glycosyltransferase involved in cell wall biosynthesis
MPTGTNPKFQLSAFSFLLFFLIMSQPSLTLALVIPALNEEDAIGSTLERALAARQEVMAKTPVTRMDVVFVNDGSTDGTQEIADRYPEVIKIHFEKNRGYGAAIKAGFQATDADLVGFMDADGTCDPCFCIQLVNTLLESKSDVCVGSRMNAESEMPAIRRLGNLIFAHLIGAISGQKLTDSASGMRIIRRTSLKRLHPLPDGLHFTPAMTCLILLAPGLSITEVPMPYKERMGQSKLRVIKDGLRFLFIILFTTALFNPIKALGFLGLLFMLVGLALGALLRIGGQPWPVVFAVDSAFIAVCLQAMFTGFLIHQMVHMLIGPWRESGAAESFLHRHFWTMKMVRASVVMLVLGLLTIAANLFMPPPWQLPVGIAAALIIVSAGWTALAGVVLRVVWAAKERCTAELDDPFAPGRTNLISGERLIDD